MVFNICKSIIIAILVNKIYIYDYILKKDFYIKKLNFTLKKGAKKENNNED